MAENARADDDLFTAAELHRQTGVSATTIKNWTRRDLPLATIRIRNDAVRFTRRDLLTFCAANPQLRATGKVLQALSRPGEPAGTRTTTTLEVDTLKSLVRDLRNAAHQNFQAVLTAARHAEETARFHREQLEQVAVSMAAYDAALTQLTAPSTMND